MKVFKFFGTVLLFFVSGGLIFSQSKVNKPADIVVLMDTSGTILQYYDDVNKRVLSEISDKFIRKGDNFHLLSFNANTRYEMSQIINTEADMSRIVSRFLLMYPLGQNSDFLTALKYCKQYSSKFSGDNDKIMIVISDGIFNPPANSEFKNYSGEQIKTYIAKTAGDLRAEKWKVYYVKLPFPSDVIIRDLDGNLYAQTIKDGSIVDSNDVKTFSENTVPEPRAGEKISLSAKNNGYNSSSEQDSISDSSSFNNKKDLKEDEFSNYSNSSGFNNNNDKQNITTQSGETKKEVVDISSEFTESLGIETSNLSEDENAPLVIEEDRSLLPQVIFPDAAEAVNGKLSFSIDIINISSEEISLNLESIILSDKLNTEILNVNNGKIILKAAERGSLKVYADFSEKWNEGSYHKIIKLVFSNNIRVMPQASEIVIKILPVNFGSSALFENYYFVYIILLILFFLLLAFFIFLLFRAMQSRTKSHVSTAVRKADNQTPQSLGTYERKSFDNFEDRSSSDILNSYVKDSKNFSFSETKRKSAYGNDEKIFLQKTRSSYTEFDLMKSTAFSQSQRGPSFPSISYSKNITAKNNRSGMTEIFVAQQNRNIGKRNIHVMKPGSQLYVGGGKTDDFLIFLVKFPSKLAQVQYDGQDYHLTILKPKYFPYESSNVVNNCIGKTITLVSDKGYHVYFTFRGYEDPAVQLNNLLKSIDYK